MKYLLAAVAVMATGCVLFGAPPCAGCVSPQATFIGTATENPASIEVLTSAKSETASCTNGSCGRSSGLIAKARQNRQARVAARQAAIVGAFRR
jgi:hypothetical protein